MSYSSVLLCRGVLVDIVSMYACLEKRLITFQFIYITHDRHKVKTDIPIICVV